MAVHTSSMNSPGYGLTVISGCFTTFNCLLLIATMDTAQLLSDAWLVHYNFFRPHMSLRDRTPASVAGIRFPYRNWKDITEQPYEKTARVPIRRSKGIIGKGKILKRKSVRISPRIPRITSTMPKLSRIRVKRIS